MKMIKIIQYFVLAALFIACKSKVNDAGLEVLKDNISEMKKSNQNWVLELERKLRQGGFKDRAIVDSAKSLIYMRDAALRNKITLSVFGEHLFEKYKTCEIGDSNRLFRAKTLLSLYNNKIDSLEYYQSLLSLLLIERDLVEEAGMMTGAGSARCFSLYIPMYSEPDTVKLNTSFKFIACGFEKLRFSYVMKINDKFEMTLDGAKVKIPIEHKIIGNAVGHVYFLGSGCIKRIIFEF